MFFLKKKKITIHKRIKTFYNTEKYHINLAYMTYILLKKNQQMSRNSKAMILKGGLIVISLFSF